ncbi:MAG TPA: hypothetical protein VF143_06240 [Candidatus Nanopelagicales bacterium]
MAHQDPVDPAGRSAPAAPPAVVSLHVWGVPGRHVPTAVTRMARHRRAARDLPGVTFAKLLGTGSARTFTPRDADVRHWGLLLCWTDDEGPARFADSPIAAAWARTAQESASWVMRPIASKGRWAGREPFGAPIPKRWDGPVAAITRGRIKPSQWRAFWSAVPPVALDVRDGGGLTFALGIGEAPVGLQGTFSTWTGNAALSDFAYRRSPHQVVITQTHQRAWYAEELFARFALLRAEGTHGGRAVPPTPGTPPGP